MNNIQIEAVEYIIETFCKDFDCKCGKVYDYDKAATWFMVVDPKTSTYIKFQIADEKLHDIAYMMELKETLYDTLVKRYNER